MSALGQKQTLRRVRPMSALPAKADIDERDHHVCFVPEADVQEQHRWGLKAALYFDLPYRAMRARTSFVVIGTAQP
jgi:hypothetical protein